MTTDWAAEGLLKGTRGKAREARRELLEQLAADGASLEDLRRAVAEGRLALLPVERALEPEGRRYAAREVSEMTGVEVEMLLRQREALGLTIAEPDEPLFTDEDVEAARRLRTFREAGLPDEGILEVSRVIGMAMAQVAAVSRGLVTSVTMTGKSTERDVGLAFAAAARNLGPMLGPVLGYAFNAHLREQTRHDVIEVVSPESAAGAREVTACFVDMVGFTRLGEELAPDELGAITGRLGEVARRVARPPVHLVKMIGDAAMLVALDPDAALEAALGLVEAGEREGEDFPLLRAGVARGPALARSGDWYGRPINLASRLTAIAYPASVLCTAEVREAAAGEYRWSAAGRRRLKGISGEVRLYRCRHLG